MTLSQGHDTPLGHGQQLFDIISRLDKGIRNYDPGHDVNRRTDEQTDRVIPIYPETLFAGGIIKRIIQC